AFHDPILDPRTLTTNYQLLADDDLRRLADHYVAAAKLARRIGFQFVDVKQCHRYLLSELLAAKTRPGPYGGSLENRTRLARNVITAIRSELPDLVVATRLNVYDCIPYQKRLGSDDGAACPWRPPLSSAWGTAEHAPL